MKPFANDTRPHATCRAKLRYLFQKIIVTGEKERQSRRENVHVQTSIDGSLHVRQTIGQRERHFLNSGTAGLAHVVSGDGDRVPLRYLLAAKGEKVGDDAHSLGRGVN